MTVKELKDKLNEYPDDMEVLYVACSDYYKLSADELALVSAVDKGYYHMRGHDSMKQEFKDQEKQYLCFPGN